MRAAEHQSLYLPGHQQDSPQRVSPGQEKQQMTLAIVDAFDKPQLMYHKSHKRPKFDFNGPPSLVLQLKYGH